MIRRLLFVSTVLAAVAGSRPAWACSCAAGPPQLGGDDAIFVGTVTAKSAAWWRLWNAGTDYRVRVEKVIQGNVHHTAWLTAQGGGSASCGGFSVTKGQRIAVDVTGGPYRFRANACSGTDINALLAVAPGRAPPGNGFGIVGHWAWEAMPILVVAFVISFVVGTGWATMPRRRAARP